jgi:hypothetical protein
MSQKDKNLDMTDYKETGSFRKSQNVIFAFYHEHEQTYFILLLPVSH